MNDTQAKRQLIDAQLASKGATKVSIAITGGDVLTVSPKDFSATNEEFSNALKEAFRTLAEAATAPAMDAEPEAETEQSNGDDDEFRSSY